jgi:hypothetical protein
VEHLPKLGPVCGAVTGGAAGAGPWQIGAEARQVQAEAQQGGAGTRQVQAEAQQGATGAQIEEASLYCASASLPGRSSASAATGARSRTRSGRAWRHGRHGRQLKMLATILGDGGRR